MASTLNIATRTASRQLEQQSDSASLDAELLLAHVLGKDRVWLFTHPEKILAPGQERKFASLIARRLRGEPLAYLTGEREFFGYRFNVNRHTLVPRPETELIVERVLELTEEDQPFQLLDLGTGSGAIGLSIARERPNSVVVATDISAAALDVARENAHKLRVQNVEFRCGSWFLPVPGQRFDIVVSNPPYVEAIGGPADRASLRFEPPNALIAGADGLDAIQAIASGVHESLYPGGRVLIEHGASQAVSVENILRGNRLEVVGCHKDLSGLDRVTEAFI